MNLPDNIDDLPASYKLPCDDPELFGGPILEWQHDYSAPSRPRRLNAADPHLFRVRTCSRCGQEQHDPVNPTEGIARRNAAAS